MATRDAAAGTLPSGPVVSGSVVSGSVVSRSVVSGPVAQRGAGGPGRLRGWLGAGAASCVVGWGANQFTPMLLLYRARLGLSAPVVEAMFGLYAIGLIPGLLVGGSLSDRIGRRRVVLSAVALSMVAGAVLLIGAHGAGWLFAGRLIMGLASGGAFSAGAAWIKELSAPPHQDTPPGAGARRAGGAMTLGFALGPLVAGVLAQWAPLPAELPYLALVAQTPETVPPETVPPETVRPETVRPETERPDAGHRAAGGPWQRLRVGGLREPRFLWVVLPLAPWVFASVAIAMVY